MRFMSYNKGLSLIVETPRRVVYPNGLFEDIRGKHITFKGGMFETEDPEEIEFLTKKCRLFNQTPGVPGAYWEYVPPRNLEAELAAKDAENEALKQQLAELEAAKAAATKKADAPSPKKAEAPARPLSEVLKGNNA